ncbi:MAG: ECF transporter S component, partial [Candidatus Lokiarchaeia archaeon]|nr:ECF transporter S component [Candidatus Lokiarchaeia archaeon]
MSEKSFQYKYKTFMGYAVLTNSLSISMSAIFASITFALTMIAIILSQGFINIGDLGVMISGLLCGPIVGFMAGAIGPCVADLILYPLTAPYTLIIKALEGFLIGIIANPRKNYKKL